MPTFDPGGGSGKIKSVKNLIKKHYHIKMLDIQQESLESSPLQ